MALKFFELRHVNSKPRIKYIFYHVMGNKKMNLIELLFVTVCDPEPKIIHSSGEELLLHIKGNVALHFEMTYKG